MPFAILFPGQGTQEVGMGSELFDARPDLLIDTADEVLGWSLRSTCLEGPIGLLTTTDRAQPAIYALSYVLWEELARRLAAAPTAAAGHSLGEYTALAAAESFGFEDGLRLVSARGRAMAAAAARERSGMAALIGVDVDGAETVCRARRDDGGKLWVANINAPGQVVVAGGAEDLEWLADHAREFGVRRTIPLNVAGAFHSPFMQPAVAALDSVLRDLEFGAPAFEVWANTTAAPLTGGEIAARLSEQVVSPVRFADGLVGMAATGIDCFVHVGPGDVTAGMAKRTVGEATVLTANSLEALDEVAGLAMASVQ